MRPLRRSMPSDELRDHEVMRCRDFLASDEVMRSGTFMGAAPVGSAPCGGGAISIIVLPASDTICRER